MQLVYYAHSYRKPDAGVVRFFADLMRSEGLIPSLDPPSNRLNSAKPERHLASTDGMIAVLTAREGGVSQYILYEVSLCLRASKPLLVFVEDTLPNGLLPNRVLQRRFSRRGLLRQIRSHRHAVQIMKSYLGDSPPPRYQPSIERRTCLLVGDAVVRTTVRREIEDLLGQRSYSLVRFQSSDRLPIYDRTGQESIAAADLAVCFVDAPEATSHLILGAARSFLTPTILLTTDSQHSFDELTPREYQPLLVSAEDPQAVREALEEQIEISEEEYVDLEDQREVIRYAELLIKEGSGSGAYTADLRSVFVRELVQIGELNMSKEDIRISHVSGIVNVKAKLDHVTQSIGAAASLDDQQKNSFEALLTELQEALEPARRDRPADVERVLKSTELVVSEATKKEPNKGFLTVTAEGLKEAAKALSDIAPTVLSVAVKVAEFVSKI